LNSDFTYDERNDHWIQAALGEWDYGQWIVEALNGHLKAVESIVGTAEAAEALQLLLSEAVSVEGETTDNWKASMEAVGSTALTVWEMSNCFYELGLYGIYGAIKSQVHDNERSEHIEKRIAQASAFIHSAGYDRPNSNLGTETVKLLHLAQARLALDTSQGGVDPASMAVLGGWSEGRVRNMMSGPKSILKNDSGRIPASDALSALQDRPAFFNSIWNLAEEKPVHHIRPLQEVLFLPVARDGSIFHPGLSRKGGYQIGEKGQEIQFDTFEDALVELQKARAPAWRRPNANGNWGIVRAVEWTRCERTELEEMD